MRNPSHAEVETMIGSVDGSEKIRSSAAVGTKKGTDPFCITIGYPGIAPESL